MRKIYIIALVVCILLISGCSSEKEEKKVTLSEEGEWQADKYVLLEYNFKFKKPESWRTLLPSEINDIFGSGSSDYYKMIVVNNTNRVIISIFFEDNKGMEQEEYLESIQKGMEKEEAVTYQFDEPDLQVVGGMEFAVMQSKISSGGQDGMLSDQLYMVHEQGERILCINIKYEKEYKEVVKSMLEENFLSNLDEE